MGKTKAVFKDSKLTLMERAAMDSAIAEIQNAKPTEKTLEIITPWITANDLHPENILSAMKYLGEPDIGNQKLTSREKAPLELLFAEILETNPNEETVKVIGSYVKACDLHPENVVSVDFSDLKRVIDDLEKTVLERSTRK